MARPSLRLWCTKRQKLKMIKQLQGPTSNSNTYSNCLFMVWNVDRNWKKKINCSNKHVYLPLVLCTYYKAKVCGQLNCVASSHTSQMLLRLISGIESSITKAVNKIFKCIKQHFMSKSVVPKTSIPTMEGTFALEPPPLEFPLKEGLRQPHSPEWSSTILVRQR